MPPESELALVFFPDVAQPDVVGLKPAPIINLRRQVFAFQQVARRVAVAFRAGLSSGGFVRIRSPWNMVTWLPLPGEFARIQAFFSW